jgi:hypothetical protein
MSATKAGMPAISSRLTDPSHAAPNPEILPAP